MPLPDPSYAQQGEQDIDVHFDDVTPPAKVIDFRESADQLSRKPGQAFAKASAKADSASAKGTEALAKVLGVSQPTIRTWMRRMSEAVPMDLLSVGRGQWSALAVEMAEDFARGDLSMDDWLDERSCLYIPDTVTIVETRMAEAEQRGAIVPAELGSAAAARSTALAQAQSLQSFAGALLEQVGQHLAQNNQSAAAEQAAINEAAIVASEMAAILREQQVRAQVRANFERQQSAAAAESLKQQLDQLKGGQTE